ncbi:unnamed protein product [Amoebophrya sp. A120]|nr:unnamed protein product [Amoebophrya sp. A120]|eukprot:GSA120T00000341001.1
MATRNVAHRSHLMLCLSLNVGFWTRVRTVQPRGVAVARTCESKSWHLHGLSTTLSLCGLPNFHLGTFGTSSQIFPMTGEKVAFLRMWEIGKFWVPKSPKFAGTQKTVNMLPNHDGMIDPSLRKRAALYEIDPKNRKHAL